MNCRILRVATCEANSIAEGGNESARAFRLECQGTLTSEISSLQTSSAPVTVAPATDDPAYEQPDEIRAPYESLRTLDDRLAGVALVRARHENAHPLTPPLKSEEQLARIRIAILFAWLRLSNPYATFL